MIMFNYFINRINIFFFIINNIWGLMDFKSIPSIPFFVDITIVPKHKASIILILVPDPNFNGTHNPFEKKVNYITLSLIQFPY